MEKKGLSIAMDAAEQGHDIVVASTSHLYFDFYQVKDKKMEPLAMSVDDNANFPQDGDRSIFEPVYFDYDSSQVKPSESSKVEAVAKSLKKGECKGVIVEGHGDERGSREYNLALGETRSLTVKDYLISLGIDTTSIQTRSFGEETPTDDGHDETAWNKTGGSCLQSTSSLSDLACE